MRKNRQAKRIKRTEDLHVLFTEPEKYELEEFAVQSSESVSSVIRTAVKAFIKAAGESR